MSQRAILPLGSICMIALWMSALGIHLLTIYIAYLSNSFAMLFTIAFPFIAELVWIFVLWGISGTYLHLLTLLCSLWLVLLAVTIALIAMPETYATQSN